ncbi:MAG: putative Na+/Ca+ antiporter, CaCA family [Promethearchaeota archaeon]|nr:MAG: putative Na+/Ca+ antiporter, CaCA family [Candidatus Lokiarchaeota archaeon]
MASLLTIMVSFLVGALALYYGAKFMVESLESIAIKLGVSQILIGLTILSIGTSLPEISVSMLGGIDKLLGIDSNIDAIVIGNIVGSFFTQITLIIGILGIVQPIFISKWKIKREGSMMVISIIIFLLFALDGSISRLEGFLLIFCYLFYLSYIIYQERKVQKNIKKIKKFLAERDGIAHPQKKTKEDGESSSNLKDITMLVVGLPMLIVGAELTLLSTHELAIIFNIPETIMGVFVLGFETSLPELVADLIAIRRESVGIAVGDLLGSNICDILLATGSGSLIVGFNVPSILLVFDIPLLIVAVLLILGFLWSNQILSRIESGLMILFFSLYAISKLFIIQA